MKEKEHCEVLGEHTLRTRGDGLPISTDALLLAGFLPKLPKGAALEIGAGAGTVSLLAALRGKFKHIDAVEIQEELASLAKENVKENRLTDIVTVYSADIRAFCPAATYPIIFSNPPYYPVGSGRAPRSRLSYLSRFEATLTLCELLSSVDRLLDQNGRFYCVYPAARAEELIKKAAGCSLFCRQRLSVCPHKGAAAVLALCIFGKEIIPAAEETALYLYTDNTHTAESDAMLRLYEEGILFPEKENL